MDSQGGTDLERGYGDVQPWRPPFHASPAARKGPISSKTVSSQDPLLRKCGNFSLNSLNFHPNLSSQAPKFGNFQLTSPQIWKFSAHKPPFSEANVSSQAPHFGNPGRTPLPEKKLSAPPRVDYGMLFPTDEKKAFKLVPGSLLPRSNSMWIFTTGSLYDSNSMEEVKFATLYRRSSNTSPIL